MTVSQSQIKATKKYEDKAYFKALVRFKKDDEDRIRKASRGNLNKFITDAVMEKMKRENL